MSEIKNRVTITVTFYFSLDNDSINKLNKKYFVRNWKDEQDSRRLLDEIASEMNHLSGYGIEKIKVTSDKYRFTVNYRDKFVPYKADLIHYSNFYFDATLRFIAGRSLKQRGKVVWLEIPRIYCTTGANNPVHKYTPGDGLLEIKARAFGGPKKQK